MPFIIGMQLAAIVLHMKIHGSTTMSASTKKPTRSAFAHAGQTSACVIAIALASFITPLLRWDRCRRSRAARAPLLVDGTPDRPKRLALGLEVDHVTRDPGANVSAKTH